MSKFTMKIYAWTRKQTWDPCKTIKSGALPLSFPGQYPQSIMIQGLKQPLLFSHSIHTDVHHHTIKYLNEYKKPPVQSWYSLFVLTLHHYRPFAMSSLVHMFDLVRGLPCVVPPSPVLILPLPLTFFLSYQTNGF